MQPLDQKILNFDTLSESELKQKFPLDACISETSQKIDSLLQELQSLSNPTLKQEKLLRKMTAFHKELQNCQEIKGINQIIRNVNAVYDKFQATVNPQNPIELLNYFPKELIQAFIAEIGEEHLIAGTTNAISSLFYKETLSHVKKTRHSLYQTHLRALKAFHAEQSKFYENLNKNFPVLIKLDALFLANNQQAFIKLINDPAKPLASLDDLSSFLTKNASCDYLYIGLLQALKNNEGIKNLLISTSFADLRMNSRINSGIGGYAHEMRRFEIYLDRLHHVIQSFESLNQNLLKAQNWTTFSKQTYEINSLFYSLLPTLINRFKHNPFISLTPPLPNLSKISDLIAAFYQKWQDNTFGDDDIQQLLMWPEGAKILAALIDSTKYISLNAQVNLISRITEMYFANTDKQFKRKMARALLLVESLIPEPWEKNENSIPYHEDIRRYKLKIALDLIQNHQFPLLNSILERLGDHHLAVSILEELIKTHNLKIRVFVEHLEKLKLLPQDRISFYKNSFIENSTINHTQLILLDHYKTEIDKDKSHEEYLAMMRNHQRTDEFVDHYYIYQWTAFQLVNEGKIDEAFAFIIKHRLTSIEVFDYFIQKIYSLNPNLESIVDFYLRFMREAHIAYELQEEHWQSLHDLFRKALHLNNFDFNPTTYAEIFTPLYQTKTLVIDAGQSICLQLQALYAFAANSTTEQERVAKILQENLAAGKNLLLSQASIHHLTPFFNRDPHLIKIDDPAQEFNHYLVNRFDFQLNSQTTLKIYEEYQIPALHTLLDYDYETLSIDRFFILLETLLENSHIGAQTIEILLTNFLTQHLFSQDLENQLSILSQISTKYPHLEHINTDVFQYASSLKSEKDLSACLQDLPLLLTYLPQEAVDNNVEYFDQIFPLQTTFTLKYQQYSWIAYALYQYQGFESFFKFLSSQDLFTEDLYQLCLRHEPPEIVLERSLSFFNRFETKGPSLAKELLAEAAIDAQTLAENPDFLIYLGEVLDREQLSVEDSRKIGFTIEILKGDLTLENLEQIKKIDAIFFLLPLIQSPRLILKSLMDRINIYLPNVKDLALIENLRTTLITHKAYLHDYFIQYITEIQANTPNSLVFVERSLTWINFLDLPKELIPLCLSKMMDIHFQCTHDPHLSKRILAIQHRFSAVITTETLQICFQEYLNTKEKSPQVALRGLEYALILFWYIQIGNWPLDSESSELAEMLKQVMNRLESQELILDDQNYRHFILQQYQNLIGLIIHPPNKRKRDPTEDDIDLPPHKKHKK